MNGKRTADLPTGNAFDVARLKRLFGPPVLLGNEKMKEFDEYATEVLRDHAPRDLLMATLVWEFILESWERMRLMRLQSRKVQAQILDKRSGSDHRTKQHSEEEATDGLYGVLNSYDKVDRLISEATKRETALLRQIAAYDLAATERAARNYAKEEKRIELKERKKQLKLERAVEHFFKMREERKAAEAAEGSIKKVDDND